MAAKESSSGVRDRFKMEEPIGVYQQTKRNHCFPHSQVGQGVGLQTHQGTVAVRREPDRGTLRLRVARHDNSDNWYRSYGNENWEFNSDGLMNLRFASINDLPILESDRKYHWPLGRRPDDHPGLSDLGL
jgi:hypothetical protein